MSEEILEQRYRTLLRIYPSEYRRERESEILETLMAAAGAGQTRPSVWQIVGLIRGALRVRAGSTSPRPVRSVLLQGAYLAAMVLAAWATATRIRQVYSDTTIDPGHTVPWLLADAVAAGVLAVALVTLVLGWEPLAVPILAAAMVIPTLLDPTDLVTQLSNAIWWEPALAAALLLAGMARPADVPRRRGEGRLAVALVVGVELLVFALSVTPFGIPMVGYLAAGVAALAVVVWLATADPRLLVVVAALVMAKAVAATIATIAFGGASVSGYAMLVALPVAGFVLALSSVGFARRLVRP